MKHFFSMSAMVLLVGIAFVCAYAKQSGYETATVVSVEKHVTPSNYVGDSPSDAPLQAEDNSYDIGIRMSCNLYVGRYESATSYLPSVFAPNHTVDVRLDKHVLYVSLPDGDRVVKMGIVSHKKLSEKACPVNG